MLCKYWIIIATSTMLLIIVQEVNIFRIIYMFLFLVFILLFQVSTQRLLYSLQFTFFLVYLRFYLSL